MRHYGWAFSSRAPIIKQDLGKNLCERLLAFAFSVDAFISGGLNLSNSEVKLEHTKRLFNKFAFYEKAICGNDCNHSFELWEVE